MINKKKKYCLNKRDIFYDYYLVRINKYWYKDIS